MRISCGCGHKFEYKEKDIYSHRLLCGDSTMIDDVEKLMDGGKTDMVFTDLPYNVDYEGYTKDKLKIENDAMSIDEFNRFLIDVFTNYRLTCKDNASLYVFHPSRYQREFQDALEKADFEIRCQIVWAKNTFAWGHGRYKFQHEPIFYAHIKGESDSWYGDKSQSTLWEENKPSASRLHPTMKPAGLCTRAITNSSKGNDVVMDLFGGSGTTLIACEKTNRKSRLMEIDPHYCDVIVERYVNFTGNSNVKLNGQSHTWKQ